MITHLLKDTVTVYTITESVSTLTGEVISSQSTGTTVKARISPLSDRESYFAQKNNRVITHRMYCDYSTLCEAGSRVAVGTSTYEVIGGPLNPSMWNKFLQIDLKVVV